ncbi:Neuropathy target esterase [Holothuria leucospilota]|uniref:Neuropathy target esterase n=1 Tax=Holothuria leucospilota TaxID=206669 RepID=A0A9Q1C5Y8_HOLLE|nr:Neuropathy target esterase [Holothuria leucospilota]
MDAVENHDGNDPENAKTKMRDLLRSGIFGNLEDRVCERLVNGVKLIELKKGKRIHAGNELHSNVHIVQRGALKLCFSEGEYKKTRPRNGRTTGKKDVAVVRNVTEGESLYSLFSIAAEMTGYKVYPDVCAEATVDALVIRLPIETIINLARENAIFKIRLLQMMLIRSSSIMRIILSIRGIEPEVYTKGNPDLQSRPSFENVKKDLIDVSHDFDLWGEYDGFDYQELLWGIDVKPYTSEDPRNTHGLMNGHVRAEKITDEVTIQEVSTSLKRLLSLDDTDELQQYITVFKVEADVEIAERHDKDMDLVYVFEGTVILTNNKCEDSECEVDHGANALLGTVSVLTGEPQQYDIKAGEDGCTVALISRKSIFNMIRDNVKVMLHLCHHKIQEMSHFVRLLDIAIGWEFFHAGYTSTRMVSSDVLFILTGRLRVNRKWCDCHGNIQDKIKDYGRGEIIGVEETLLQRQTEGDITVVRNSQIARIPTELCEYFMEKYPRVFFGKISDLVNKIIPQDYDVGRIGGRRKFSTLVCIPLSDKIPLMDFQNNLKDAVERYGINFEIKSRKDVLDSVPGDIVDGEDAKKSVSDIQIRSFLGNLERDNTIICYNTTSNLDDDWSSLFLKQADLVFVVGEFHNRPSSVDSIQKTFGKTLAEKALILLHKPTEGSYQKPVGTTWWIDKLDAKASSHFRHFHIRCPKEMFNNENGTSNEGSSVNSSQEKICDDFGRLARYILGRSVGLVLGGGGARGFAHVGIIKALQEYSIPIDVVGGTSMGAFVGAAYSSCTCLEQLEDNMKVFCAGMNSYEPYMDLTIPVLSVSTGKFFDKNVREPFGDSKFEDLWIPYFNITTDITDSKMTVNTTGTLWEYVRASMSLALLVPPVCSEKDGHYLLDGGSVNNLPADVMKEEHGECKHIVAVDVGGKSRSDFSKIETHVSGSWLLWNLLKPFGRRENIPGFMKIITRLSSITGEDDLKRVMNSPDFDYIRPHGINIYGLMDFHLYDTIRDCGYDAGKATFKEWKE